MQQSDSYNSVAKFFHWSIALLIFCEYCLGLTLDYNYWYDIHKQIGLAIFVLVVFRIVWRFVSKYPDKMEGISKHEQSMAVAGQVFLYILMLAVPFCGIMMTQVHGYPLNVFGIVTLPLFFHTSSDFLKHSIGHWHYWLANTIMLVAFMHALIALVHHYKLKDRLLRRMLPDSCSKK